MGPDRIVELLQPFGIAPTPRQLEQISTYIDLLLKWNARINLTAVRDPEEIVTRHFGESLFAARNLFAARVGAGEPPAQATTAHVGADALVRPAGRSPANSQNLPDARRLTPDACIDLGSGAGFPGLPIKLWVPDLHLTLIESNHKKATFLREAARALTLTNIDVFAGRAEDFPGHASLVTLRAVERFEKVLPIAAGLVAPGGRLALLIGLPQASTAHVVLSTFRWDAPLPIPLSSNRVLLVGQRL